MFRSHWVKYVQFVSNVIGELKMQRKQSIHLTHLSHLCRLMFLTNNRVVLSLGRELNSQKNAIRAGQLTTYGQFFFTIPDGLTKNKADVGDSLITSLVPLKAVMHILGSIVWMGRNNEIIILWQAVSDEDIRCCCFKFVLKIPEQHRPI